MRRPGPSPLNAYHASSSRTTQNAPHISKAPSGSSFMRTVAPKALLVLTVSWDTRPGARAQACLASRARTPRLGPRPPACLAVSMTVPATSLEDVAAPPGQTDPHCLWPPHSWPPRSRTRAPAREPPTSPGSSTWGQFPPRKIPASSAPTPHGPGDPQAPLLFLARRLACLSLTDVARETKQLRALAPKPCVACGNLRTLLNLCCASIFSSAKWGR